MAREMKNSASREQNNARIASAEAQPVLERQFKNSGIAWIGEIPKEWEVCRLKNYCELHGRIGWNGLRSDEFEENSYAYLVTGQDFRASTIDWNKCYQIRKERYDEDEFIQLHNDELLVTKDGTIGKVAVVANMDKPACLNSGIFVLRQHHHVYNANYLYWLIYSPLLKTFNDFMNLGGTTIVHLYQNVFERMPLLLPSLSEQQLIANFLDEKCGEIDELVALQEKMIDELKAYKQSVITETVTKGLDKNVKMKDSGVDWIGEIPEHWEFTKIKLLAQTTSGSTPRTISNSNNANIKWFRTTDINEDVVSDSPIHLTDSEFQSASCPMLEPNTCLVAMYGGAGTIGKFGMLSERATINQALCSITPLPFMDSKYIFHTLKAIRTYWMKFANGTRKDPNINQEIVRNMLIVVPPLSEQQQIATYLDEKCSEIDSLISIKQKKIEELKDYKKSLIYEYVTGKKQVG